MSELVEQVFRSIASSALISVPLISLFITRCVLCCFISSISLVFCLILFTLAFNWLDVHSHTCGVSNRFNVLRLMTEVNTVLHSQMLHFCSHMKLHTENQLNFCRFYTRAECAHTHTQSQLTQKYLLILLSFPIFSFPFIGIFLIRCSFTSSNRLCSALYSALKLLYSVLPFLFISYLSSSPPSSLGSMSLSRSHWALSLLVWWRMLHALALFSFILQHFFLFSPVWNSSKSFVCDWASRDFVI